VALAVDPDEDLVQTPAPMGEASHRLNPLSADLTGSTTAAPFHSRFRCPRSARRSSTWRSGSGSGSGSGSRTDILTTVRLSSGELPNHRNGWSDLAI